MKEYQSKKNNPYKLPHHLYMRIIYTIRDYERLKDTSAPSAKKEASAIENALFKIPDFYREGVIENIINGSRYPMGADERTFRRYKQRYIYLVADMLSLV